MKAAVVLFLLVTLADAVRAQESVPRSDVLVAAFTSIHDDVASARPVLQSDRLPDPVAAEVAAALGYRVLSEAELFTCQNRSCELHGDGAFGFSTTISADPQHPVVEVWSAVQMSGPTGRWVFFRTYRIGLRQARDGSWEVVHRRLVSVS